MALLATVALAIGCDQVLKAPDARYADVQFDAYLKSSELQAGAHFGQTLALDDAMLAVGAPFEDVEATTGETLADVGAVHVFDLNQLDAPVRLTAPNADAADGTFPETWLPPSALSNPTWGAVGLALDQDWLAVGLPGEDGALIPSAELSVEEAEADNSAADAGAVYLYRRSDLMAAPKYVKAPNAEEGDLFGFSVALSAGWLAVGAIGEGSSDPDDSADNGAPMSGAIYLYRYDPELDDFVFQQYLKAPRIHENDVFGSALSIEGDLLAVGASLEDGAGQGIGADYDDVSSKDEGAVYTYVRADDHWTFETYLKSGQPDRGAAFGMSVKVFGGRIAVGQPFGYRCPGGEPLVVLGVAYVFSRQHGTWSDIQCLDPAGREQGGLFGLSLAGHENRLIVGAPWDPAPRQSGTAYAFEQDESGRWQELTSIVAPNSDNGDGFGNSIGVTSTTIAIGALSESGSQAGLDADLANNDAYQAGAAYLFSM
jgi:trimeric autotransporter adhesin